MSSSPSRSSTCSASGAGNVPSADEIHLFKVAQAETIRPLLEGVPRTREPVLKAQPGVLRITYSHDFDDLMSVYRTMRANPAMYGSGVAHADPDASTVEESVDREVDSVEKSPTARWLLVLAFALRQSTSNYTIWKDRRDAVLSPTAFLTAHVDCLPSIALSVPTSEGDVQEKAQSAIDDVAHRWLPHTPDDYLSDGMYSVWRAVRWELGVTSAFARLYHKQFQVWHHRKELIGAALAAIPAAAAKSALCSVAHFDAYLRAHHNLTFADVDERRTIDSVLLQRDAKNYHVWLHRAWFFQAFPFLLEPPSWPALCAYADRVDATVGARRMQAVAFQPEIDWCSQQAVQGDAAEDGASSLYITLPQSAFTDELHFTAGLIRADPWNNSVWCHRFVLFKAHLIPSLLERLAPGHNTDGEVQLREEDLVRVVGALCWQEAYFALQWAAVTPCNECPHVHARCVAEMYQTVMLRVSLLGSPTAGISADQRSALLAAPLISPVQEATASHDAAVLGMSPSLAELLPFSQHLNWRTYSSTFALLMYTQDVTRVHLVPRVDALIAQFQKVAAVRDASEREAAMRQLISRGESAQYVMDNFHQCVAAQYHALFYFLEQCWLLFFSESSRAAIVAERPSSFYAYDGVNEDLVDASQDGESHGDVNASAAAQTVFLEKEVRALLCVKELHMLDTIRAKYWRHEASTVLHRQY